MSTWIPSAIKRVDGFQRDWWIRTSHNKSPLSERTQLITHSDPSLDDCNVKMEIVSLPITYDGKRRADNQIQQTSNLITIMSENDTKILQPDNWTITQMEEIDRAGPTSFAAMPFSHFLSFWRQPLEPRFISMEVLGNGTAMINFRYMDANHPMFFSNITCNIYLSWKGLFDDLRREQGQQRILPWLKKNCEGKLYIFSDFDSIFESPEDEFRYIADLEI